MKEELAEDAELPAIGKARIARPGTDVTLIAYSAMVQTALEAARKLAEAGISAEVIDLRTLLPLDMPTIAASVSKTHRALVAHEAVQNGGAGEPLLEVETEKSVVEIEAAATGRLAEILVQADSAAAVGDQVAWIESADVARARGERILSTPVARKLAAERGIDLAGVSGSG